MDTVIVRRLRPYEKMRLQRLKRQHGNAVNRLHARVILLSRGKVPNREIAVRVGCTPQWVRSIIHRFNADGILGILWGHHEETTYYDGIANRPDVREFLDHLPWRPEPHAIVVGGRICIAVGIVLLLIGAGWWLVRR